VYILHSKIIFKYSQVQSCFEYFIKKTGWSLLDFDLGLGFGGYGFLVVFLWDSHILKK